MSGYYEPHPRLHFERPIVLAGQIGCGAAAVAWQIAAQTGLRYVSIDRLIEHEAGRELARLAVEEGLASVVARTDAVLARVVGEAPFGLIVIDHAWPSRAARDTLRDRALFVHLHRSPDHLARQFEAELRRGGDWILRALDPAAEEATGLPALCAHRETLLREAEVVLEGGELHAHALAQLLLESLERLVEA